MQPHQYLNYGIATVWLVNGLFCKVFNLVPRHQLIVARITGSGHAVLKTRMIGAAETGMAAWIISGIWPLTNAITQAAVIAAMNILEFIMAPDLLLWGRFNALFAFSFILLILCSHF